MGDEADWMIEQMIWGCNDDFSDDVLFERVHRSATDVAEERFDEVAKDKKVKDLNKGVFEW